MFANDSWMDWQPDPEHAFREHEPTREPYASMSRDEILSCMRNAKGGKEWEFLREFLIDKCAQEELHYDRFMSILVDEGAWEARNYASWATRPARRRVSSPPDGARPGASATSAEVRTTAPPMTSFGQRSQDWAGGCPPRPPVISTEDGSGANRLERPRESPETDRARANERSSRPGGMRPRSRSSVRASGPRRHESRRSWRTSARSSSPAETCDRAHIQVLVHVADEAQHRRAANERLLRGEAPAVTDDQAGTCGRLRSGQEGSDSGIGRDLAHPTRPAVDAITVTGRSAKASRTTGKSSLRPELPRVT